MAQPLEEFLVGLGFKIDEASQKRWLDSLDKSHQGIHTLRVGLERLTRGLVELSAGILTAGLAVTTGVVKMASAMNSLYFQSQQTGASVQGIQALGYAYQQAGRTADEARAAISGVAAALRENPQATRGMLQRLGIDPNEDISRIVADIGPALMRAFPGANLSGVRQQYAQRLGIDPNTLLTSQNNNLRARMEEFTRRQAAQGVNPQQAAGAGVDLTQRLNKLQDTFKNIQEQSEQTFGHRLANDIGGFQKYLEEHSPAINALINGIGNVFVSTAEHAGGQFKDLSDQIDKTLADYDNWKKTGEVGLVDWSKWEPAITQLKQAIIFLKEHTDLWQNALEAVAIFATGSFLSRMLGMFARLAGLEGAGLLLGRLGAIGVALGAIYLAQDWLFNKTGMGGGPENYPTNSPLWNNIPESEQKLYGNSPLNNPAGTQPFSWTNPGSWRAPHAAPAPELGAGANRNNPLNLRYAESEPFVSGQRGGFAAYSDMVHGVAGAAHQLQLYGMRHINTLRQIINKWAPPSENDTGAYLAAVVRATGWDPDQQLDLSDPAVLNKLIAAMAPRETAAVDPKIISQGVALGLDANAVSKAFQAANAPGTPDPGTANVREHPFGQTFKDLNKRLQDQRDKLTPNPSSFTQPFDHPNPWLSPATIHNNNSSTDSSRQVTVHNNPETNVTITAVTSDPISLADTITRQQRRQHADMLRSLRTVVA